MEHIARILPFLKEGASIVVDGVKRKITREDWDPNWNNADTELYGPMTDEYWDRWTLAGGTGAARVGGFYMSHLQYVPPELKEMFRVLTDAQICSRIIAKPFLVSHRVGLAKPDGGTRPIDFGHDARIIIDALDADRVARRAETLGVLSPSQFAFQRCKGAYGAVRTRRSGIETARQFESNLYLADEDRQKATTLVVRSPKARKVRFTASPPSTTDFRSTWTPTAPCAP